MNGFIYKIDKTNAKTQGVTVGIDVSYSTPLLSNFLGWYPWQAGPKCQNISMICKSYLLPVYFGKTVILFCFVHTYVDLYSCQGFIIFMMLGLFLCHH